MNLLTEILLTFVCIQRVFVIRVLQRAFHIASRPPEVDSGTRLQRRISDQHCRCQAPVEKHTIDVDQFNLVANVWFCILVRNLFSLNEFN